MNLATTPEAINLYSSLKNVNLFERHKIFTKQEIVARQTILFENYIKQIRIESLTTLDIFQQQILPAIIKYEYELSKLCLNKKQLKLKYTEQQTLLKTIDTLLSKSIAIKDQLIEKLEDITKLSIYNKAQFYCKTILGLMTELRLYCDQLERLCPKTL